MQGVFDTACFLGAAPRHTTETRYRSEPATMRPEKPRADAPAPSTVLIAEDDPDVTRIVDFQMRAAGYHTVICVDGRQTLEALQATGADVLVLDLGMPKLTGFDVLRRLRELPARPRVIVLSGRIREEAVTRAFDLGADDYLAKPFSLRELMARVARLLERCSRGGCRRPVTRACGTAPTGPSASP
jgi:DNA-binding response OmpR family regulator